MGWASGSTVMTEIIDSLRKVVTDSSQRRQIYMGIIKAMENHDWDTQDECLGLDSAFDKALKDVHPNWEIQC